MHHKRIVDLHGEKNNIVLNLNRNPDGFGVFIFECEACPGILDRQKKEEQKKKDGRELYRLFHIRKIRCTNKPKNICRPQS
ncbi:MAG: hypothetical protein AAF206_10440, partial [Bacteroidota bacterium]